MDSGETILRKEVEKYPVLEDKQQLEQLDKYKNSERWGIPSKNSKT